MKQAIKLILTIFLFTFQIAFGQQVDTKQVEVAKTLLNSIIKGQTENSWELFDKKNVPDVTKEQFDNAIKQLKNQLSLFDTIYLTMSGITFAGDKQLNIYTFKAFSKTKNIVDDISIDVSFFTTSQLVAGIRPKQLLKDNTASTSRGPEITIEKNFTADIDGTTYKIRGINIVHFDNNEGLLVIQVEYALPAELEKSEGFAKKEAIRFAKYLVNNGYVDKAKIKAKEIDIKLLEQIGVSFFDSTKGGGFNVVVKPNEFK